MICFSKKREKTSYGHEIGSPEVSGAENKTPGRKTRPEFKFDFHFFSVIDFKMFLVFVRCFFFCRLCYFVTIPGRSPNSAVFVET